MPKREQIADNARIAKAFAPMPPSEMKRMSESLSSKNKTALDLWFRDHLDAC
jgi:hypothetical protein